MKPEPKHPGESSAPSASTPAHEGAEGRFAYEGLDRVIHERARLSILTALLTHPKGLTFSEVKQLCSLTDGNLSRHLTILEQNDMVQILKAHERNRPVTTCKVTAAGRKRYLEYLATLEQVIRDAERSAEVQVQAVDDRLSPMPA